MRMSVLLIALTVVASQQLAANQLAAASIQYTFDPLGRYCLMVHYAPASYALDANGQSISLGNAQAATAKRCADACTSDANCRSWTFVEGTVLGHSCWDISPLNPTAGAGGTQLVQTAMAITGLEGDCNCPSQTSQSLTGSTFPAAQRSDYATLFSNSQYQPAPLACWPKDVSGNLKLASPTVLWSNRVPQSDATYMEGWCQGMVGPIQLQPGKDCESACGDDVFCSGYQTVPVGMTLAAGCYTGAGYGCEGSGQPVGSMEAQQYTRGEVKVLASVTQYRVQGLRQRFDEHVYTTSATTAQGTTVVPDWLTMKTRCREMCYSDLWCSAWQLYDQDFGAGQGCFAESDDQLLPYPLDRSADMVAQSAGVYAGEFIQHWWKEDATTTSTTTTTTIPTTTTTFTTTTVSYLFSPFGDFCLLPQYAPPSSDLSAGSGALLLDNTGLFLLKECAIACINSNTCQTWSYVETATSTHQCWDITGLSLSSSGIHMEWRTGAMTGVAGHCNCPSTTPSATPLSSAAFPSADVADYETLFANSQHQPAPLACWPKNERGELKPVEPTVQLSNQVAATAPNYFTGWCQSMTQTTLTAGMDCKSECAQDLFCEGYKLVPTGISNQPDGCFTGVAGSGCNAAAPTPGDMRAETFIRGQVRVIATMTKWQLNNLKQRFDESEYTVPAPQSGISRRLVTVPDWQTIKARCQQICYSDLWCSAWQVYDVDFGTGMGCFTESDDQPLPYPLDADPQANQVVARTGGLYAGEFIQHWFPEDTSTTTTAALSFALPTALPKGGKKPLIVGGLAALAALCVFGACCLGRCCGGSSKVPKPKHRAMQPVEESPRQLSPRPEPDPVPTKPSPLISAPVVSRPQAFSSTVTYAAPAAQARPMSMSYTAAPVVTSTYRMVQQSSATPAPRSISHVSVS